MIARRRRVLALMHETLVPPETIHGLTPEQIAPFKTEYDVVHTLRALGHQVTPLGVRDDLEAIGEAVEAARPDVVFNLLEEFAGQAVLDQNVVSYLELLDLPYTGCGPRGLMLARDKVLSKKVLAYHRIRVPEFVVFPRGRAVRRPRCLDFPLFVKSRDEDASLGIARASLVEDEVHLRERVAFIHERVRTDAIAERFIPGRELYVAVLGNGRLRVLPVWELLFGSMPEDRPHVATARVKWDTRYQQKWGISSRRAELDPVLAGQIARLARRIYRALGLCGYARIDFRLTPDGQLYVLEANPNPQLARNEDLADSAQAAGLAYPALLQRILTLGLCRNRCDVAVLSA